MSCPLAKLNSNNDHSSLILYDDFDASTNLYVCLLNLKGKNHNKAVSLPEHFLTFLHLIEHHQNIHLKDILDLGFHHWCNWCNGIDIKTGNPLAIAVRFQNARAISLLLEYGACPNIIYDSMTVLTRSILCKNLLNTRMFLAFGANPNLGCTNYDSRYPYSSLTYALHTGDVAFVKAILSSNIKLPKMYFSFQMCFTLRFPHYGDLHFGPPGVHIQLFLNRNMINGHCIVWSTIGHTGRISTFSEAENALTICHSNIKMHNMSDLFRLMVRRGCPVDYIPLDCLAPGKPRPLQVDPILYRLYQQVHKSKTRPRQLFALCISKLRSRLQRHPLSSQLHQLGLPLHLIARIINWEER
jgi:ankyrin repeat protein